MMAAVRSRRPWSALRRIASGSNSAAARAMRDHATNAGAMPASTAILMKRYGTPQITELRMKRDQARGVIGGDPSGEAPVGIEPTNRGFADLCLTTWLRRQGVKSHQNAILSQPTPRGGAMELAQVTNI